MSDGLFIKAIVIGVILTPFLLVYNGEYVIASLYTILLLLITFVMARHGLF